MIEPAEEIYVLFDKNTGDIRTGSGKRGYKVVHAYLSEKMGWCACTLEEFYTSTQLFGFLPVGMMTGSRRIAVHYKP